MRKNAQRRIVLSRETLRQLNDGTLRIAVGGITGINPASCNESCVTQVSCPTQKNTVCTPSICFC